MSNPLFITIEGGEGAGKSTLVRSLLASLTGKGFEVLVTREPGGTPLGESIRSLLLEKRKEEPMAPLTELFLFLAARAEHLDKVILPSLKQGKIVICDRFNDSTIAYQGAGRKLDLNLVKTLCKTACVGKEPDLTFFMDVDPSIGLKRASWVEKKEAKAGEKDRMESEELLFHQKVREGFFRLMEENPQRIKRLDGMLPKEEVLKEALYWIGQC